MTLVKSVLGPEKKEKKVKSPEKVEKLILATSAHPC